MPSIAFIVAGAYFALFAFALLWNLLASLIAGIGARVRSRQFPSDQPTEAPGTVVTLVHGTWGRRAAWTEPGSPLRDALQRAVDRPLSFQRFTWSGSNSISARRRAVRRLVEYLHAAVERWPHARHYVVAHSHGGNIAFQAFGDPLLSQRLDGLVCLSTPFLTVVGRDLGPVGRTALWWLPVLVVFYGGVFVIQVAVPTIADRIGPIFLVAAVASGFLSARWRERLTASVLASLQHPAGDPSRTLILRAAGDEASAALGAAHFVSWVSGRLWLATSHALGRTVDTIERWRSVLTRHRFATAAVVVVLLALSAAALFGPVPTVAGSWLQPLLVAAGVSLLLILATLTRGGLVAEFLGRFLFAAVAAPFLLLIALVGISLGPELLAAGLLFQVTAEATPPGQWTVWQVAPTNRGPDGPASSGLSHSASYQNPEALRIIELWLASRIPHV